MLTIYYLMRFINKVIKNLNLEYLLEVIFIVYFLF